VAEILPLLLDPSRQRHVLLDGDSVSMRSSRLETFVRSVRCACCGITGMFFVKERHRLARGQDARLFHLNLYALDKDGNEILMTSDHIVPRSKAKGLRNNRQTMCERCNRAKGNREISNEALAMELEVDR